MSEDQADVSPDLTSEITAEPGIEALDAVGHADAEAFLGATLSTDQDIVIVDLAPPCVSGGKVIEWRLGVRTPPRVVAITGERTVEYEEQIAALHIHLIRQPLTAAALPLLA